MGRNQQRGTSRFSRRLIAHIPDSKIPIIVIAMTAKMPCKIERPPEIGSPIISTEREKGQGLGGAKEKRRERKTCVKRHCRLCPEERTQTLSLLAGIRDSPLERAWEWRHAWQQQRHTIREVLCRRREKNKAGERGVFQNVLWHQEWQCENNCTHATESRISRIHMHMAGFLSSNWQNFARKRFLGVRELWRISYT